MSTDQLLSEPETITRRPVPVARPMPSLRFRRVRALVLLVAVVLLVWGGVRLIGWVASDAGGPGSGRADVPPPPTSQSASAALVDVVAARTQGIKGDTAVGVLDLGTGVTATYAVDKVFPTASIVKLDILAALLLQSDGELTQGQEARAKRMIQNSDNAAATALWKAIGGAKGLNRANQTLGLTRTTPGTQARWGLTTTTVADQLRLLSVIFTDDSPLSAESRGFVRTLMGHVADDQAWGVSAGDDPGGAGSHLKNGWLPRSGGWIVNSVGQVEHAGHTLLVVALSDGRPSKSVGIDVLEGISADAVKATTGG
ncbi:serine hydrolase [Microlunatus ginsengisoli]|uniref:Serine hydrolase n=1 Tax=Microlunatus ginsengisoli TaxID=363863 RepID=A0ABP6ZP51_9ACTN